MKSIKKHLVSFNKSLAILTVFATLLASQATALAVTQSKACQNTTTAKQLNDCVTQSPFVQDIQKILNFLSAGVGIVVIGVIILGGIQYSMAGDNSQAVGAAKQRIINGLIALVAFIFMFAFLNWLLPGGAFG
jgi:hypothetical protein